MTSADHACHESVDCSVLVPVYNEERYIEASIAAMRRQQFPGRIEIICADGGSTDRTLEILAGLAAQDERIRVFHNPRRTVTSGLNLALSRARGPWVARMDAHTEYPADYLAVGVQRLRRGETSWVSGPQTPRGDGRVSRAVALALSTSVGRGGSRKWGREGSDAAEEFELDTGVFAGVWSRSTLLEYGGWDERWRVNEDSELAARFLARGERLICVPAMAGAYAPRNSIRGLWRQYLRYGEYRFKTAVAHPLTLRRSNLLPPAVVLDATLSALPLHPLRRAARYGLVIYLGTLVYAGVETRPRAQRLEDSALVPLMLAIMHLGHGLGALRSAVKHGPPLPALAFAAGVRNLPDSLMPDPEPVFAPSLVTADPTAAPPGRVQMAVREAV